MNYTHQQYKDAVGTISIFELVRKNEFEYLWKNQLSMISPIDNMPSSLRDKIKEFAWKVYLEGSITTQITNFEIEKELNENKS